MLASNKPIKRLDTAQVATSMAGMSTRQQRAGQIARKKLAAHLGLDLQGWALTRKLDPWTCSGRTTRMLAHALKAYWSLPRGPTIWLVGYTQESANSLRRHLLLASNGFHRTVQATTVEGLCYARIGDVVLIDHVAYEHPSFNAPRLKFLLHTRDLKPVNYYEPVSLYTIGKIRATESLRTKGKPE